MSGTPVAPFILLDPGVQFKAIEGDALGADRDLRELRPDLGVEPVAVHAEIERRVAKADEARKQGRVVLHTPQAVAASDVAVFRVLRVDDEAATTSVVADRLDCCARPVCPMATMDGIVDFPRDVYPMENNSSATT